MAVSGIITGGLLVSPSKIITNGLFSSAVVAAPLTLQFTNETLILHCRDTFHGGRAYHRMYRGGL